MVFVLQLNRMESRERVNNSVLKNLHCRIQWSLVRYFEFNELVVSSEAMDQIDIAYSAARVEKSGGRRALICPVGVRNLRDRPFKGYFRALVALINIGSFFKSPILRPWGSGICCHH